MEKSIQIALIIAAAIVIVALVGAYTFLRIIPSRDNTINVQGQATIKAVPDLVSVYFSAETQGETAEDAKNKNSEIVDNMITGLIKKGLERKDIITENFNVYPNYVWRNNKQEIDGYKATHSIKVELPTTNTDKIGSIIDIGVDSGALINYINFELSPENQNKYKAEAMKKAAEDARIKADSTASGLRKKVGKLVSVSVNSFDYYPWQIYRAEGLESAEQAKAAATSIQPGDKDISASVSAVFKIL